MPAGELAIPDAHATAVFRIFQEILTNIARHAQASVVVVTLLHEDSILWLEVEDNGVGMEEGCMNSSNSLGILGMQERAEILGGKVSFRRNRPKGTAVTVQIPLPEMPAATAEPVVFHPAFVEPEGKQSAA